MRHHHRHECPETFRVDCILNCCMRTCLCDVSAPHSQNPSDFPAGFDALQSAPDSHKLLFENAFVRVLEVYLPRNGKVVPMHHHRWPSLVINWDTGGGSAHIHYLRPGQPIRDIPSIKAPTHRGAWKIHWMEPEPMHSIELVALPKLEVSR